MNTKITNKTIVLTGASSGIGLECLKILAKGEGNVILAVSRQATQKLKGWGSNVIPFDTDISTQEGVDKIFAKAEEMWEKIDIYYQNAGWPYYEVYDYENWERTELIYQTNVVGPAYTYAKYMHHLNGREGHLAFTVSAIGQMAMPGYALYSSSKFALEGFQQAIRLEMPDNMKLTCLYPVATDTNFFVTAADGIEFEKPFPVQKPTVVARKMIKGIEDCKESVSPCPLFAFSKVLMTVCPPARTLYWYLETQKLWRFKKKIEGMKK